MIAVAILAFIAGAFLFRKLFFNVADNRDGIIHFKHRR